MGILEIVLIGIALSMDAFSVSVSNAMSFQPLRQRERLSMPFAFGVFQAAMPLMGFFVGGFFSGFLEKVAGPVTFVILGLLGALMLKSAIDDARAEKTASIPEGMSAKAMDVGSPSGSGGSSLGRRFTFKLIFVQAVATSIDALGVGFSFVSYPSFNIAMAVSIIGLTTAAICFFGVELGTRLGERFGVKARIVGGVILILIGIRALL